MVKLLLKSYVLLGNSNSNTEYLIICEPNFKGKIKKIIEDLGINGFIWDIDLNTIFEARYSRLRIFEYFNISKYDKILYLDCDILVTNSISNILNFTTDDKLYALQEGYTNKDFWGKQFFSPNPNIPAFTSGILLFNNCNTIKKLFNEILEHIEKHLDEKKPIPEGFDQPFIVYHAISKKLYNNTKLIGIVINNPSTFSEETISHFQGEGYFKSKIVKMTKYLNNVIMNNKLLLNKYINRNIYKYDDIQSVTAISSDNIQNMILLLNSKNINNINLHFIGLGQKFQFIKRITWMRDYLQNIKENNIIVFTDAYDVFYLESLDVVKSKFLGLKTNIVWSTEKWYSKQLKQNKFFYEKLCDNISNYKYLNGGGVIGFRDDLLNLYNDIIESINNKQFIGELREYRLAFDDQAIISHHLAKYWDKYNIKLDYNCEIFYTPVDDWDNINNYINDNLVVSETGNVPCIIHVPWKTKYLNVLSELFFKKYNYLIGKTFSWNQSNVHFLKNFEMNAFGKGTYYFINKYLIKCDFGGREHYLKFSEDYSKFISIRKNDFEIVKGEKIIIDEIAPAHDN